MAKYKKEHLQKLLDFLRKEIILEPENKWFVEELYKSLTLISLNKTNIDDLQKIEKYLGLDFKLDSATPIIDYSFIENEYLRNCFEADWREMMRYRFSTRGHIIDFYELCRFAMMQIERLVNVYCSSKGATIEEQRLYVKNNNPEYIPGKENKIEEIPFMYKFWALRNEFKMNEKEETKIIAANINHIRNVRNIKSHASSQPNTDDIFFEEHYAELRKRGFPFKPERLVDWKALQKDPILKDIYNKEYKDTPDHKRYQELVWQRGKPFDEVMETLNKFVALMSERMLSV